MAEALKKNPSWKGRRGPVVLCIMDGVGYGKYEEGDAVRQALTKNLDSLEASCPTTHLTAHGKAVGLPSDADMGNSEVGHNAIGCGRVFAQGAKLVQNAIESGAIFKGDAWNKLISSAKEKNGTLHLLGLLSDGNVHSHHDHLKALCLRAKEEGIGRLRVHALLDGRDVGETSALDYFEPMENFLKKLSDDTFNACIASGGGRMVITMDRYGANWSMVELGWKTHVLGEGEFFPSPVEAITALRERTGAIDQDLPPFVIDDGRGNAVGSVNDGDSVILFNFRGDRALEITSAFEDDDFSHFDRVRRPKVEYAGMMEYDGDLHIPNQYLVSPPSIDKTLAEYLCVSGISQFSISETQKYGHVTYFFNGNRLGKFDESLEEYVEIPSDIVPFEERPVMKSAEITDRVVEEIKSGKFDFIKLNFPNGDMVGHTGVYQAVVCSMEMLDLCVGRIAAAVKEAGGVLLITADHGNADDMFEHDKKSGAVKTNKDGQPKAKTAHSLNPVPFIIYDPEYADDYSTKLKEGLGISSVTATCLDFLGLLPPDDYDEAVITLNN